MDQRSLYERVGGESIVRRASDLLYAHIMLDDRVNYLFEGLDVTRLVERQSQFLTYALGGLNKFGQEHVDAIHLKVVSKGFGHSHFDVVVELLRSTLTELDLDPDAIEEVLWRVEITRKDVLKEPRRTEYQQENPMFSRIGTFLYGIVSYTLGMAALAYLAGFIGNFLVHTTLDAPATGSMATAIAINIGLIMLFAIQHSGMARPSFKKVWTRIVPKTVERSTYILFTALALIPIFVFWQPVGVTIWQAHNPGLVVALYSAYGAGWAIVVFSTFLINHFDLFGLRQVWLNLRGQAYTELPFGTPMLYRMVRHPLYLGWLIVMWATPTMTISHLVFAATLTIYIFAAIRLEERNLKEFHPEYEEYTKRVPMIIPTGNKNTDDGSVPTTVTA